MSKKLQNPKEKLAKYLANIGFASRRNISNFIKNNEVRVNNKKSNHDSIIKDGDILAVNGEVSSGYLSYAVGRIHARRIK